MAPALAISLLAGAPGGGHEKIAAMDIERINQIGTLLAALSSRTEQLRGYL